MLGEYGPETDRARACDDCEGSDKDWRIVGAWCLEVPAPYAKAEPLVTCLGPANAVRYGPAVVTCVECE